MNKIIQRFLSVIILITALILLGLAFFQKHKVHDPIGEEFGIPIFFKISECELVIDATFHGVKLKGNKLYSTYDRKTDKRGKRTCPT